MRLRMAAALVVTIGWVGWTGHSSAALAAAPFPPLPPAHGFHLAASPRVIGGSWYYMYDDEWTPFTCAPSTPGVCEQEGIVSAGSDMSASVSTPTGLYVEIDQYSVDTSGVLHYSYAYVDSYGLTAPGGVAGPLKPGPTLTQGGIGLISANGAQPGQGTARATALFVTSTLNGDEDGDADDGVVQGGTESLSVTGTIHNEHLTNGGWVNDPNTTGTITFSEGPTMNSDAWACSSVQSAPNCED